MVKKYSNSYSPKLFPELPFSTSLQVRISLLENMFVNVQKSGLKEDTGQINFH